MTRSRLEPVEAEVVAEDLRLLLVELPDLHLDAGAEWHDAGPGVVDARGHVPGQGVGTGEVRLADVEQHQDRLLGQEAEAPDAQLLVGRELAGRGWADPP